MDRITRYWPEYYLEILDFLKLAQAEGYEFNKAEEAMEKLLLDQVVSTSSIEAIKRREEMLGIQADPTKETIEFRRKRIVNRYSTKPPFTLKYLQERFDFLVGEGKAVASVDVENFILTVTTAIQDAELFKEVENTINTIKPANLVYQQQTGLGDSFSFEERLSAKTLNRQTRLGTWKIGTVPFAKVEAEVILK